MYFLFAVLRNYHPPARLFLPLGTRHPSSRAFIEAGTVPTGQDKWAAAFFPPAPPQAREQKPELNRNIAHNNLIETYSCSSEGSKTTGL